MKFETKAIHVGEEPNLKEGGSGDVVVPIHTSVTYARKDPNTPTGGYEYSRTGNPTRHALEKRLAALENADFGLAFASGLAAESTLLLSLLKQGDHVIAFDDLYGGTRRLFDSVFSKFGIGFTYVDATDVANVENAINSATRMIWLETPTNPMMNMCDIRAMSSVAKDNDLLTVVDNTFMSPYFQTPLDLGADLVLHSTTKYLGGHSDVVGGAIMVSDPVLHESLRFNQNAIGAIPSPFDCYLVLRGCKTLALRMERHNHNAQRIAEFLNEHPRVKRVYYPGLVQHPQHELAKRQMRGFGGMISFELDGNLKDSQNFLSGLKLFAVAESLGGVESLIEHPASMTHASVPQDVRAELGITDSLLRISVGVENVEDLIADLESQLNA